jgi:glutamine synthetase
VGFRDFVAMPDLKTARINPLDPEVAVVLCDLMSVPAHTPSGLDQRGSLKRITERYAALGYTAVVAHELEFYLLERHADGVGGMRPLPMRDSSVYTVGPLADPTGLVRGMFEACEEFGLEPISMAQEFGHSQHEINLTHGEAVAATDRAFLFKSLVKQMADMNGVVATFMGMPVDDDECSGYHLHASLVNKAGKNLFDAPRAKDGLSEVAHHFIAGVIAHAPAMAGLLNPTVNSYKRISNGGLSPKFANWGHDNRLSMLRISQDRGPATRAEVRSGDGAANPYLISAAILAAGLDGIERKLKSPKPVVGNFYEGPESAMGTQLPTSLGQALDTLEADTRLVKLIGPELIEVFLHNKRYELARWEAHQNRLTAWEIEEYAAAL